MPRLIFVADSLDTDLLYKIDELLASVGRAPFAPNTLTTFSSRIVETDTPIRIDNEGFHRLDSQL